MSREQHAKTVSEHIVHPWPAFYRPDSQILILGTIPSPASRKNGFYYGHPQNIFWRTLAQVLEEAEPAQGVEARKTFLELNRIALWDVLREAEILGAADASIQSPQPQRFAPLLKATQVHTIFTTGKQATSLFNRLCASEAGTQAIYLPSTSPANRATQAKPEFLQQWQQVEKALGK